MSVEPFIGEIALYPYDFVPKGWLACDGRHVSADHYSTLFSLIGNTYGGDSPANFALPDLRGAVPVGMGAGPGLDDIGRGGRVGASAVTLNINQQPRHQHALQREGTANAAHKTNVVSANADLAQLAVFYDPANPAALVVVPHTTAAAPNSALDASAISTTGANHPHENRQPFATMTYAIAIDGHYPPRP